MARVVKCGLIQAKNAAPTDAPIEDIKRLNKDVNFQRLAVGKKIKVGVDKG